MIVLTFHKVLPQIQGPLDHFLAISPDGLRTIIRYLRTLGYTIQDMQDVLESPKRFIQDKKSVLLTFDDGYENFYDNALAVMVEEKCSATIFALPGRFGGQNVWDTGHLPEDQRDTLLTLEQMKEMGKTGLVRFGSHGMLHEHFPQLSAEALQHETMESYKILSQELSDSFVPILAYPWGEYSEPVCQHMKELPYQYAFTVNKGIWTEKSPRFEVPRHDMYFRDGNPLFLSAKIVKYRLY